MKRELIAYYLYVYNKECKQIACDWGYFYTEKQALKSAERWMMRLNGYYCHVERCYR